MRVAITATKKGATFRQLAKLRQRLIELRPSALIHGGCVGGDNEADIIAAELGIHRYVFPSTRTDLRVPNAVLKSRTGSPVTIMAADEPLKRNPRIVAAAGMLLAIPRQKKEIIRSGTWTTVRLARRAKLIVEVIDPD